MAVNAKVSSEKYTPRRRSTRKPMTSPDNAASATANASGQTNESGARWIWNSAAAYAPRPKKAPCPNESRPV